MEIEGLLRVCAGDSVWCSDGIKAHCVETRFANARWLPRQKVLQPTFRSFLTNPRDLISPKGPKGQLVPIFPLSSLMLFGVFLFLFFVRVGPVLSAFEALLVCSLLCCIAFKHHVMRRHTRGEQPITCPYYYHPCNLLGKECGMMTLAPPIEMVDRVIHAPLIPLQRGLKKRRGRGLGRERNCLTRLQWRGQQTLPCPRLCRVRN